LLGNEKFCSIYQAKDRVFHILYCAWNNGKLVIYDELESNDSISLIARNIIAHGTLTKVSGNERMFGTFGEDVSSQLRKFNITAYENYRYDEAGAVECLNLIVSNKRIIIHSKLSKIITQLRRWSYDKRKNELDSDFGLCYSLLNIISELKDKIMPVEYVRPFIEYSTDKSTAIKNIGAKTYTLKQKSKKRQSW
jgi:hypothetical protein